MFCLEKAECIGIEQQPIHPLNFNCTIQNMLDCHLNLQEL